MPSVRALNTAGIEKFREFLRLIRRGEASPVVPGFAFDDSLSVPLGAAVRIEPKRFKSKLELAAYLFEALQPINRPDLDEDKGLWSWLALYYFDQLAPVQRDGLRIPREDYHYIPDLRGWYAQRHLAQNPYKLYRLHGNKARLFLYPPVHQHGAVAYQVVWRNDLITNRGLIEAMDRLYFDERRYRPKRGAGSNETPGSIRRLITVVQQLDFNYDLQGMAADEILELLPAEFDPWRN